jgi:hypothetical protein
MTEHRELDPFTAEQLLSGQPVDPELSSLADLLAAAAAGPRRGELDGEAVAVDAFRDAAGASRPAVVRSAASKALAIKVAVALTAVAGAGMAAAAATGNLPGRNNAQVAAGSSRTSATASPGRSLAGTAGQSAPPSADGSTQPRSSTTPSHPTPTPPNASHTASLFGLCQAYVAVRDGGTRPTPTRESARVTTPTTAPDGHHETTSNPRTSTEPRPSGVRTSERAAENKLLDLAAYRPLVRAAGGKAAVSGYCEQLLAGQGGGSAPQGLAPSPIPSVTPSGRPTDGPTSSRPAATPTGMPTASPPPRGY